MISAEGLRKRVQRRAALRWLATRFAVFVLVFVVGGGVATAAVVALGGDGTEGQLPRCPMPVSGVRVDVRVQLAAGGLDFPRLSADTVVRVPRRTAVAAAVTSAQDDPAFRQRVACLLGVDRAWTEIRDGGVRVAVEGDWVTVRERAYVDVVDTGSGTRPREVWAGLTRLSLPSDGPWRLSVTSPAGLAQAVWTVSVRGPADWLSAPRPLEGANMTPEEVRWDRIVRPVPDDAPPDVAGPMSDFEIALLDVAPDWRAEAAGAVFSREGRPVLLTVLWASTAVFAVVTVVAARSGKRWRRLRGLRPPFCSADSVLGRRRPSV
ncbi:hypothetical protein [Alloactinosynnema sp. L-07]|uniref:DUF6185 family protein n=1 Tax=Alloactinosynnema sp. L-07 TaxID=1653480 RepID=UPI00065EF6EF|nr:DUF6185 family protein [Alloactinosynnema sp. L-07]CRK59288.1 hypothetical protein [Alloactinosynnema sp. L-07]